VVSAPRTATLDEIDRLHAATLLRMLESGKLASLEVIGDGPGEPALVWQVQRAAWWQRRLRGTTAPLSEIIARAGRIVRFHVLDCGHGGRRMHPDPVTWSTQEQAARYGDQAAHLLEMARAAQGRRRATACLNWRGTTGGWLRAWKSISRQPIEPVRKVKAGFRPGIPPRDPPD